MFTLISLKQTHATNQVVKAAKIHPPAQLHRPLCQADFIQGPRKVIVSVFFIEETIKKCAFKLQGKVLHVSATLQTYRLKSAFLSEANWTNYAQVGKTTKLKEWDSTLECYLVKKKIEDRIQKGGIRIWCFVENDEDDRMLRAVKYWENQLGNKLTAKITKK